jgi:hypothetical protein
LPGSFIRNARQTRRAGTERNQAKSSHTGSSNNSHRMCAHAAVMIKFNFRAGPLHFPPSAASFLRFALSIPFEKWMRPVPLPEASTCAHNFAAHFGLFLRFRPAD